MGCRGEEGEEKMNRYMFAGHVGRIFELDDVSVSIILSKSPSCKYYNGRCISGDCSEEGRCKLKEFYDRYPNYVFGQVLMRRGDMR